MFEGISRFFKKRATPASIATGTGEQVEPAIETVVISGFEGMTSFKEVARHIADEAIKFFEENPNLTVGDSSTYFRVKLSGVPKLVWNEYTHIWDEDFWDILVSETVPKRFDEIYQRRGDQSLMFRMNPAGAPIG